MQIFLINLLINTMGLKPESQGWVLAARQGEKGPSLGGLGHLPRAAALPCWSICIALWWQVPRSRWLQALLCLVPRVSGGDAPSRQQNRA